MAELCRCGKPLHYSDPEIERFVRRLITREGEYTRVTVKNRTWLVPRHYIALHGVKALDVHTLGFREVTPNG